MPDTYSFEFLSEHFVDGPVCFTSQGVELKFCVGGMNQAGHKFGVGREKIHLTFVSEKSYVLFLCLHFVSNNS